MTPTLLFLSCRHYPKQSFTMVADTPENLRLKQQSELQSQVRGWPKPQLAGRAVASLVWQGFLPLWSLGTNKVLKSWLLPPRPHPAAAAWRFLISSEQRARPASHLKGARGVGVCLTVPQAPRKPAPSRKLFLLPSSPFMPTHR